MAHEFSKTNVLGSFLWKFAERCGTQGVKVVVEIILARLLVPDDYGTIALVTVFITILNVFVDSGLGNALIQKKDADDIDFSTVLYFNVALCLGLYLLLYFAGAPLIAQFYAKPGLTPIIRVLGLTVVISGVKNVQQAYVSRTLQFKCFFYSSLVGTILSAVSGIIAAYSGWGVWSLVLQQILFAVVNCTVLWFTVKWRPVKAFSLSRLRTLFSYGWKLLVSTLINAVYNNFYQLIIGKLYSSADLAYYNKGDQFPKLFLNNISDSIDSVLFPTMSNTQDNKTKLRYVTSISIRISTFVMAPLMLGMAVVSPTLVKILLTEKWMPCVPFMQVFCITYMFYPVHTANLNAVKALGRSDLFLKLEMIKKVIGFLALLITVKHGPMAMAFSLLCTSIIAQIINAWPNKKLLKYGYGQQLKDVLPNLIAALGMCACVSMISFLGLSEWVCMALQIVTGSVLYIFIAAATKNSAFFFLLDIIKSYKKTTED